MIENKEFKTLELSPNDENIEHIYDMNDSFKDSIDNSENLDNVLPANIDRNLRDWLNFDENIDVSQLQPTLMEELDKMLYGVTDANGKQTLGLDAISKWKHEGPTKDAIIKQQAGYAAEVLSTTKDNLIAKANGDGTTTYRTDDITDRFPKDFTKNDQYVDKVKLDADGNIVERIQTKFVGTDGKTALDKLMSKDFEKYVFEGNVDKIEIPKDFYQEIRDNGLIEAKRNNLTSQLERTLKDGKTDVANNLQHKLDKLNRLDEMLVPSSVTMNEAIKAVKHPTRIKAAIFAKEALPKAFANGAKSGLIAAGITAVVSTLDNAKKFAEGEITKEEMVDDIIKETAAAGLIEGTTTVILDTVSKAMSKSSSAVIQKIGNSCLPAAVVSMAVTSYGDVKDYMTGVSTKKDLAYDIGENAVTIAGSMAAGAAAGTALGSVLGPAGAVAGNIIGGVAGAVIASEVYATGVEYAKKAVEAIKEEPAIAAGAVAGYAVAGVPGAVIGGVIGANKDKIAETVKELKENPTAALDTAIGASIGFIVAGVPGAVVGGAITHNYEEIVETANELKEKAEVIANGAAENISATLNEAKENIGEFVEDTKEIVTETIEQIKETVPEKLDEIQNVVENIQARTEEARVFAKQKITETVDMIKENFPEKVEEVKNIFNDFTARFNIPITV